MHKEREIKWTELPFRALTHCYNLETAADFGLKLQPTTFSLIFFSSQCYNLEIVVDIDFSRDFVVLGVSVRVVLGLIKRFQGLGRGRQREDFRVFCEIWGF